MNPQQAAYELGVKKAHLDLGLLQKHVPSVQLGEEPNTLTFKTPSGHTVTTPYSAEVVHHQVQRMGGPEAYHGALGRALQEHAAQSDKEIEHRRDSDVATARTSNTLEGGLLGALGGGALGSLGGPGMALGGAALGGLAGGMIGHGRHVSRESGPTEHSVEEIKHLYSVPPERRALEAQTEKLKDLEDEIRMQGFAQNTDRLYDRLHRDRYGFPIYDGYSSPYRYRHSYPF